jgi:hypothetical protein
LGYVTVKTARRGIRIAGFTQGRTGFTSIVHWILVTVHSTGDTRLSRGSRGVVRTSLTASVLARETLGSNVITFVVGGTTLCALAREGTGVTIRDSLTHNQSQEAD